MKHFILAVMLLGMAISARAETMLLDAAAEARARALGNEIRCAVCAAQSINDSDATMAADFRRLVRERIAAGDSDQQIRDYLAARYGDYILLRPPLRPATWLLWLLPAMIVVGAGFGVVRLIRARGRRSA